MFRCAYFFVLLSLCSLVNATDVNAAVQCVLRAGVASAFADPDLPPGACAASIGVQGTAITGQTQTAGWASNPRGDLGSSAEYRNQLFLPDTFQSDEAVNVRFTVTLQAVIGDSRASYNVFTQDFRQSRIVVADVDNRPITDRFVVPVLPGVAVTVVFAAGASSGFNRFDDSSGSFFQASNSFVLDNNPSVFAATALAAIEPATGLIFPADEPFNAISLRESGFDQPLPPVPIPASAALMLGGLGLLGWLRHRARA